ncbi:hypothetical protein [Streptomyces sp. NPDC058394]|uniref:hypothetical protein n=1 Tax=unclassified Streptomyces TaxID=2593676 RepID=UPI0036579539
MHSIVLLLRSALGLGGGLVGIGELTRQASGPGWRNLRVFFGADPVTGVCPGEARVAHDGPCVR